MVTSRGRDRDAVAEVYRVRLYLWMSAPYWIGLGIGFTTVSVLAFFRHWKWHGERGISGLTGSAGICGFCCVKLVV